MKNIYVKPKSQYIDIFIIKILNSLHKYYFVPRIPGYQLIPISVYSHCMLQIL